MRRLIFKHFFLFIINFISMANLTLVPRTNTLQPTSTVQELDSAITTAVNTLATSAIATAAKMGQVVAGDVQPNTIMVTGYRTIIDTGDNVTYTAQIQYNEWR
jgi:hypothetical protein